MTDENSMSPDSASSPTSEPSSDGSTAKTDQPKIRATATAEVLGEVERRLSVEVPWEDVRTRLDEAFVELGRGVTIKGFRRGKVPRRILEQLFGKHLVKEVGQRLIQESIPVALEQTQLVPASEPAVENPGIVPEQNFRFQMTFQILPEIDPTGYFDLEVKMRKPSITDDQVEAALRMKQREHTAYKPIEGRPTRAGDVLLVDVIGRGGKGEAPIDIEGRIVELGDPPNEPLPGLAAALTGIPCTQDELEVELDLTSPSPTTATPSPDGTPLEEKRRAKLLITIKDVKEKVVPELDDDFAKDTGEAETLDGLRKVLRQKLLEADEQHAKDEAKQDLIRQIVAKNQVPVVPAVVDRYLEEKVRLQKSFYGMDPEEPSETDTALKEHLRESTVGQVKAELVLEAIARKEKVVVVEVEVEKRISEIAQARGQNSSRVRSEFEKEGRLDLLRGKVREDKTLDLLMSKAKIIVEENSGEPPKIEAAAPSAGEASSRKEGGE